MIWALLVFLGVPLWLCVIEIITVIHRNRALRRRRGDIPVRVRAPGETRWARGHAVWISDVFVWRGSPAGWNEVLLQVHAVGVTPAEGEERRRLRRLGENPLIATMTVAAGTADQAAALEVAVADRNRAAVLGPFQSAPNQNPVDL